MSPIITTSYHIKTLKASEEELVKQILQNLEQRGLIAFTENESSEQEEAVPATEDQVQEIIDEAELGPYYSEQEAKNILKL